MNGNDEQGRDDALIARAQAAVEREVEGLDAETRARLSAARRAALAELDAPGRGAASGWRPGWVPVGAAAAVAVIAVGVAFSARTPAPEAAFKAALEPATELEVLLADEDLALYDEELEFYDWLDEQALAEPADAG